MRIALHENVFAALKGEGDLLRAELKEEGVTLFNLMASPGAGKTTFLSRLLDDLVGKRKIGVIEADCDGEIDSLRMEEKDVPVTQIHTDEMCYVDVDAMREGLKGLDLRKLDAVILENVGNLLCPAEFDCGAHHNLCLYSVTDGLDKLSFYSRLLQGVDAVLISKIDALPYFSFDLAEAKAKIAECNPHAFVFPFSAKTGEGMEDIENWFLHQFQGGK